MNARRTFRKMLLVQVLLGIMAFALAMKSPMTLIIGGLAASLAWYLVESPNGRPMPQWSVNLVAMGAIAWLVFDLFMDRSRMAQPMGRFTICVQVGLLFGSKRNREYALILVLSVIQIIGATIVTESMVFGLLLTLYGLLMLMTILMFQLATTSEQVEQAVQEAPPPNVKPPAIPGAFGRGHKWQFRITAALVGVACAAAALVIFVGMPRGDLPRLRRRIARLGLGRQVGFSETVSLTGAPLGAGSDEIVLTMKVKKSGKPAGGKGRSWLVRGAALDQYDQSRKTWRRSETIEMVDENVPMNEIVRSFSKLPRGEPYWEVQIAQRLNDTQTLFSVHPVCHMSSPSIRSVRFNPMDQQLSSNSPLRGVNLYIQHVPTNPSEEHFDDYFAHASTRIDDDRFLIGAYLTHIGPKFPQIRKVALRIFEESGMDDLSQYTDLQKVQALAAYLRNHYRYDLTNDHFGFHRDPTSEFLLRTKRGHCEMFASALAAMAREIKLPSRLVTGFRATEFNSVAGHYTVRQSDAHAWCEIYCTGSGWVTFDATPGLAVDTEHAAPERWYTPLMEIYEHLEMSWVHGIVSYDRGRRERILEAVQFGLKMIVEDTNTPTGKLVAWLLVYKELWGIGWITYTMLIVILINIVIMAITMGRRAARRHNLLGRFGLFARRGARPGKGQAVRFYATMIQWLARRGHERAAWQSPRQFAVQLAQLDPMRYGPVLPLTELFYEVRFGHRDLDDPRRARADDLLAQLKQKLAHQD